MYSGYTLRAVLDEYAITFFALLNEGYRLEYAHYKMLAHIVEVPNMEASSKREFYQNLQWASTHPSDILKPSGEGSSPAEIKRVLGG